MRRENKISEKEPQNKSIRMTRKRLFKETVLSSMQLVSADGFAI